jgi:protein gp37
MGAVTAIDWTDATHNYLPWRCRPVSRGCDNCYASQLTNRYQGSGAFESGPPATLRMHRLLLPLTDAGFRAGKRILMESMSDPFFGALPLEDQALVWAVMAADPAHIYQGLTKRPGVMQSELARITPGVLADGLDRLEVIAGKGRRLTPTRRRILGNIEAARTVSLPLPNLMLGVSAEDRHWWKIRVDLLRAVPAAARFVSAEPLLGDLGAIDLTGIDWVICGGESGRDRRRMDLDWARSLRDQCQAAGVAFWFKQVGGITPKAGGDLLDGRQWKQHYEGIALAA